MTRLFYILFSLIFLSSCNPETKYAEELKDIDSYTNKLDSIEIILNGIEFDSLVYMQETAHTNEKLMKRFYVNDTIDESFAQKLAYIKSVRKILSDVKDEQHRMFAELKALKVQLSNLKTDILNGLYNKEQIVNYLNKEKKDVDMLNKMVVDFNKMQSIEKNYFYYATPDIETYLTKAMNEKQDD